MTPSVAIAATAVSSHAALRADKQPRVAGKVGKSRRGTSLVGQPRSPYLGPGRGRRQLDRRTSSSSAQNRHHHKATVCPPTSALGIHSERRKPRDAAAGCDHQCLEEQPELEASLFDEMPLTYSVYRKQTVHEVQIESWRRSWLSTAQEAACHGAHHLECVHPGVSTDCPAEVSLAGAQAARPRLGAGATKRLREERRRRRRESSYAVLAASKGVEPAAVEIAAERRRNQRRRIRVNNDRTGALPIQPRQTKLNREEELQLVATYQEWKAVEQSLQAWAQGNGRPATLEVMADELGYPGGARQLRLLQRDALAAREEIHSSFIALIIKLAKVFEGCGMRQEDLVTEGLRGLDKGLLKFDPSRGNRLSTVVVWWIRDALYKSNSDQGRVVRFPTSAMEHTSKVIQAAETLKICGEPSTEGHLDALVTATGLKKKTVQRIVRVAMAQSECSLDTTVYGNSSSQNFSDASGMSLLEQLDQGAMEVTDCVDDGIFGTDAFQAQSCLLVHIGEALSSLPERDAYVLKRCFGLVDGCEAKLKDIGSELSLTPSRVAQIRDVALERLRHDRRYSYLREYAPAMVDQI